jgi:hypothetical protein
MISDNMYQFFFILENFTYSIISELKKTKHCNNTVLKKFYSVRFVYMHLSSVDETDTREDVVFFQRIWKLNF